MAGYSYFDGRKWVTNLPWGEIEQRALHGLLKPGMAVRYPDGRELLASNLQLPFAASASTPTPTRTSESTPKTKNEYEKLLTLDHTLRGGIVIGVEGHIIEIQARATEVLKKPSPFWNSSDPKKSAVTITGMARGAITESLMRIQGAFAKCQIPPSPVKMLINLAPANLPKEGTWLDLPLAIIMLQAAGHLPDLAEAHEQSLVLMGEVGLHGEIRRVPGVLSIAFAAGGGQRIIVPTGNEKECSLVKLRPGCSDCSAFPASTLQEVIDYFAGKSSLASATKEKVVFEDAIEKPVDFGSIRGQNKAKQAALICAAGGHNLLLIGPPGEGKSLLAGAISGILPNLTNAEIADLTRIYSACGLLDRDAMAVTRRPMRTINSGASTQAIVGGGAGIPKPGEITLSHLGILFMDEFPEFTRAALEGLRQPMEAGTVRISRTAASLEFPSRFTLVAAMNPCPCGFYGYGSCSCKETEVKKYQKKISGPILDRIDLQVEMTRLDLEERFSDAEENQTAKFKAIVQRARDRQLKRFEGTSIPFNAAIPGGVVREYCNFSEDGFARYKDVVAANSLSTRSMDRLAKVSRTIADIANAEQVDSTHIDKAVSYVIGGMLREAVG